MYVKNDHCCNFICIDLNTFYRGLKDLWNLEKIFKTNNNKNGSSLSSLINHDILVYSEEFCYFSFLLYIEQKCRLHTQLHMMGAIFIIVI